MTKNEGGSTGIGMCMVGTLTVSLVSVWFPAHKAAPEKPGLGWWGGGLAGPHRQFSSWEMTLGVTLTLLSMFVLALRLVLEEIIVSDSDLQPLEVHLLLPCQPLGPSFLLLSSIAFLHARTWHLSMLSHGTTCQGGRVLLFLFPQKRKARA